jgi:hypothetical protein
MLDAQMFVLNHVINVSIHDLNTSNVAVCGCKNLTHGFRLFSCGTISTPNLANVCRVTVSVHIKEERVGFHSVRYGSLGYVTCTLSDVQWRRQHPTSQRP